MTPLFFEMKLAHLSALQFCLRESSIVGLTPARVDMLRAILRAGGGISQRELRRVLCVSAATVSIMVRAIEQLGFVSRSRNRNDARTFWIQLKATGEKALREIFYQTRVTGYWKLAFGCLFDRKEGIPGRTWDLAMNRLKVDLRRFRQRIGRGSSVHGSPWSWDHDDEKFYFADIEDNPVRIDLKPTVDELLARDPNAFGSQSATIAAHNEEDDALWRWFTRTRGREALE